MFFSCQIPRASLDDRIPEFVFVYIIRMIVRAMLTGNPATASSEFAKVPLAR